MSYKLNAVFIEINDKFEFYRYFWGGMDAFYCGESSSILIDKRVTSYKLEKHEVFDFDSRNEDAYYKLATRYRVIISI